MNVRFCPSCRSLLLSDFRYCPYCGAAAPRGPELAEALDAPFARLEASSAADSRGPDRFAELDRQLARLEADMDLLIGELAKGAEKPR